MKGLIDGCRTAARVFLFSSSKRLNISDVNEHLSQVALSFHPKSNFCSACISQLRKPFLQLGEAFW